MVLQWQSVTASSNPMKSSKQLDRILSEHLLCQFCVVNFKTLGLVVGVQQRINVCVGSNKHALTYTQSQVMQAREAMFLFMSFCESKAFRVKVATHLWRMPQLLMRRSAHRFTMFSHQNCWYQRVSNHCMQWSQRIKEALDVSHPGGFHWGLASHLKHLLPVVFGQVGNSKEVHCHHQQ